VATNPLARRDLLLRGAELLHLRQEEFIEWLTRDGLTQASTTESKASFIFRKPLGVIDLINPLEFPPVLISTMKSTSLLAGKNPPAWGA
jgi:acyl-CoA reductase-like NAD-dependent aldehyde dehydrogenase